MAVFVYRRAGAVVVDRQSVLLVSMQPPGEQRWWHFPGGGIEPGETPVETAVRELFEETGLRAIHAREWLRAGVHGGYHHYFLVTCEDLEIGAVTGPELEYAADADFRAEWVPIERLASMPVFPRCVAERLVSSPAPEAVVPWVEDDRASWDGIDGAEPPTHVRLVVRAVITIDGRLAAIERARDDDHYFTLPGGGIAQGESAEAAAVREAREGLGVEVVPRGKLAVVVHRRAGRTALQTYLSCEVTGGTFGTGAGEELTEDPLVTHGSYRPVLVDPSSLPPAFRPAWLAERLEGWLADPRPPRPERFCEFADD